MMKNIDESKVYLSITLIRNTQGEVDVNAKMDYRVTSEGVSQLRPIDLELTAAQKKSIKTLADSLMRDVKSKEGVQIDEC